jgi:hypothetical protein
MSSKDLQIKKSGYRYSLGNHRELTQSIINQNDFKLIEWIVSNMKNNQIILNKEAFDVISLDLDISRSTFFRSVRYLKECKIIDSVPNQPSTVYKLSKDVISKLK